MVIQHVRERFSCRDCETIAQTPAPFHPIPRGRAGPNLLAEVMMAKFGLHLPLHRQSQRFAHEGVSIDVSTLAGWVGAVTTALSPLVARIEAHVRGAERLHLDDTPVPVLAKGKTRTGRLWTVVRDNRPCGRPEPPAAADFYSPDRSGAHAETWLGDFHGIVQADAFSGFGRLYEPGRKPGPLREAACWAHARRKFFELAELRKAPIAIEAVTRIDAIFAIERAANGLAPDERCAHRRARSAAVVADLEVWLRENRARLSAKAPTAAAIDFLHKRWAAFTRFHNDGRICLSNNAAERSIRPIAVGRRNWTFAGSDAGGHRTAALYTLIKTVKLNGIDPQAWLTDVLARLLDHPARRIDDLLPWNCPPLSAPSDRRLTSRRDHDRSLHRRRTFNIVERTIRPLALNRKNALIASSEGGGQHWAVSASLTETCKLVGVEPHAYPADIITRIVEGHPQCHLNDPLSWAYPAMPALKAVA